MYVYVSTYMYVHVHVHTYIVVCMYSCIYIIIYIRIYICTLHICINNQSIHPLEATKISPYAVDDDSDDDHSPGIPWADPG